MYVTYIIKQNKYKLILNENKKRRPLNENIKVQHILIDPNKGNT